MWTSAICSVVAYFWVHLIFRAFYSPALNSGRKLFKCSREWSSWSLVGLRFNIQSLINSLASKLMETRRTWLLKNWFCSCIAASLLSAVSVCLQGSSCAKGTHYKCRTAYHCAICGFLRHHAICPLLRLHKIRNIILILPLSILFAFLKRLLFRVQVLDFIHLWTHALFLYAFATPWKHSHGKQQHIRITTMRCLGMCMCVFVETTDEPRHLWR